jgi:hypothetical protein
LIYYSGTIAGNGFAGFQLGQLPASTAAHLNNSGSAVQLVVTSAVNTAPTNIVFSVSGGTNLNLSWPTDHTGWRLYQQTNSLANGVSRNTNDWGFVPGSDTTNAVSIPLNKTIMNEYYKMVYP